MSSFIALVSGVPNRSFRIVCIRVRWNHSNLSGCAPRGGVLAGRLVENREVSENANLSWPFSR